MTLRLEKGMDINSIDERSLSEEDLKLLDMVRGFGKRIKVMGIGGAGCNTINSLVSMGDLPETEIIAMNTDAQSLFYAQCDKKIILGMNKSKGLGCGSNIEVGEASARESYADIAKAMKGASIVFVTCGMGGGTGTGSAPVVAEIAKSMNCISVFIVTMPFKSEGAKRWQNAENGLKKLRNIANTVIVIPNNRLLESYNYLALKAAFNVADEFLSTAVREMVDMVTQPGLVNRDLSDLQGIFRNGGLGVMGVGESENVVGLARVKQAIETALTSPLLVGDISRGDKALVIISGSRSIKLEEVNEAIDVVSQSLKPFASIMWGVQVDNNVGKGDAVRVLTVICGIDEISMDEIHSSVVIPQDDTAGMPADASKPKAVRTSNVVRGDDDLNLDFV